MYLLLYSCLVCEHCQNSFKMKNEFTQSKRLDNTKCNKCYVCSETDLHNAEVFKGVTFCSSCAQRIFQSCDSVKRKKQQVTRGKKARLGLRRHSPMERRRRHETSRPRSKKLDRNIHHVIELSQHVKSSSGSYHSDAVKKRVIASKTQITAGLALQITKNVPYKCRRVRSFKKQSTEIGITTDVTQELLNEINACFKSTPYENNHKMAVAPIPKNISPMISRLKKNKEPAYITNKPICSDLRIAELGVSTEIANMALRKKSEVPVIIRSDNELKAMKSYSDSFLNQTDKRDVVIGLDSAYGSLKGSEIWVNCLDGGIGNIMKVPIKFFKKNILNRSSLVNLIMTRKHKAGIIRRIKDVFYEDLSDQQAHGIKRLYSTINRRKIAYKLGWLHLASKISRPSFRCKHYKTSDSYRCMRDQAMKSAGPTRSQLACVRRKIKGYMTAKCVRDVLRCLYIGNSLSIPEEAVEQQTQELVSGIIQQSTQERIQKLKINPIQQTVQKTTRQPNQQSSPQLVQQSTRQSSRQPSQQSQQQPVQELTNLSNKSVIIRQRTPLINQQPYQQITHQPIQQIVPAQQLIHQPNHQTVYQTRTSYSTEKQKGMEKKYRHLITTVSC